MKSPRKFEEPELLKLLNSRSVWNLPPFRNPNYDAMRIENAARTAARAEPSDPFTYARVKASLRAGLDDPSEVLSTAQSRIRAGGGHV